jgi:hypothetical protein
MLFLSNEQKEKWLEHYVERETAVARKRVQHTETAITQELKNIPTGETARTATRKP